MAYTYEFEQIGLTADVVALSVQEGEAWTVLIRRGNEPYRGSWALPGGYIEIDELFEQAARREFKEETALEVGPLHFFGYFDAPGRDPRRRVATAAFYAPIVKMPQPSAGDDADRCRWVRLDESGGLAFDHDLVIETALQSVRSDILCTGVLPEFLPGEFSRGELEGVLAALADSEEPVAEILELLVQDGLVEEQDGSLAFASSEAAHWLKALAPAAEIFLQ